jgi:ATP-dependent Lhr-like helicase
MLGDPAVLDAFHPLIAGWFRDRFGVPTAPQAQGWPRIAGGDDVLIAAPTGSGKTLAAFLACVDALVRAGLAAPLPDQTRILYVSPLKALSNDVQRNLEGPLAELAARAAKDGVAFPAIRVGVRTGDTPDAEREKMAKRPPHILVTTPESLYILLTSARGRKALANVGTVIVDEIHAIAGDKRGAHLGLTLERLDRLVAQCGGTKPVRVGLSATQKPIERVARLLVGARRPLPHVVDAGHRRAIDLAIEITDDELGAVASLEQLDRVYDRIAALVGDHQTTLVFTNTRRMVERVAAALEQRLGEDQVVAHHGSMSRALRLAAEQRLKHGQVRCAVATASLELGIDVGAVDLVVQLGSPRAIATLLQRVGRSGHHLGGTPKGRMFALTRDQLVECAALIRGVRGGNLDEVALRVAPLDILAQQIVATVAAEDDGLGEDEVHELVTGAACYAELPREQLEQILVMLSEGVSERRARLGAHLHRDRVARRLRPRRGARLAAITSGGAIPDNANYAVVQFPEEIRVGEVDEDFAIDSSAGDIFQLGNTSWRIKRVEAGRVIVEDARGLPPTIPFWFGEAPARTRELSDEVSALRKEIDDRLAAGHGHGAIAAWLADATAMPPIAADQCVAYLAAGRAVLGALPRGDLLIAERFFDEGGGMQLILHAPLGGRINRAWGLALRKRFCRSFDFELQAAATDDGIVISLGQPHSFPLDTVFGFLPSVQAEPVLVQALLDAPMFEVRWRWNATRSLAVLRRMGGKRIAPHLLRMRTADMLSVVFPQAQACAENITGERIVPDHPLVFETIRDCLVEAMDAEGLTALMGRLERGEIQVLAKDTVEPSVLCHELVNANPYAYLDDAGLEDRRTRAVSLRRGLPAAEADTTGALDPDAIATAEDEVRPVARDADELADVLQALWLVPAANVTGLGEHAARWISELAAAGRAVKVSWTTATPAHPEQASTAHPEQASTAHPEQALAEGERASRDEGERASREAWVATERLGALLAVVPGAITTPPTALPDWATRYAPEDAMVRIVAGQLDHRGPVTGAALAAELGLPVDAVVAALIALEADGAILRGRFRAGDPGARPGSVPAAMAAAYDSAGLAAIEWCNRRILARLHRLTLARLRREIEPVTAAALMRFLLRWQRVAKHTQLIGGDGLVQVIEQLQGFETAAGAWEREVLPARLHGYDPSWLDQICLGGQVTWCRMRPASRMVKRDDDDPASTDDVVGAPVADAAAAVRCTPSRAAPLAIMLRAHAGWLRAHAVPEAAEREASRKPDGGAPPELDLGESARAVHALLADHGAAFLADLVERSGQPPDVIEDALWELVSAGLATADGFASLRVLVDRRRGEVKSPFDPARAVAPGQPAPPPDAVAPARRWLEAVKKARSRDRERPAHAMRALPTAVGRWSLLPPPRKDAIDAEAWARQLLARYGVVFRDLVARETSLPPWRELVVALRRLEARGEIRGGRFVAGFVGEQFALPEAADGLRAARHAGQTPELCRVAATDPLNLVGILAPGPRVPAVIGNAILYRDGVPVASREAGEVVLRVPLEPGARVDADLAYHPPPARPVPPPQASLPL